MAASALNKIVDLDQRRQLSAAESTSILDDCRDLATQRLGSSLREMLADVEESLFRQAEASYDRELQNLYLEARGRALEKWPQLEAAFSKYFSETFNQKKKGEGAADAARPRPLSASDLRLVEEEALDEGIAKRELATRWREQNEEELALLGERVALLLGKRELKDEENPVSPQAVCDALTRACDELEGSAKLKLVLLKQIEQHVARALHTVYADLNSEMVRRDILPGLRTAYGRAGAALASRRPARQGAAGAEAGPRQDGDFADDDLLARLQQIVQGPARGRAAEAAPQGFSVVPGGPAPAGDRQASFIDALTEMQRQDAQPQAWQEAGLPDLGTATGAINVLHQLKAEAAAEGVGQLDAITIDVVAILFDFIFDDEKIPDAIKALVGRLQIPVLKVAMLDKAFFSSRSHPVRRLLDGISNAAISWGDTVDPEDPLYRKISLIVERIQNDFERDVQIFTQALEELNAAIAERDAAADGVAARSADILSQRETEQIAEAVATEAVRRRLGADLPQGVSRFLREDWQRVLKALCLRHGEDHPAYRNAQALMDDLVWSVMPKKNGEERKQLVAALPGLLRSLHAGLDAIGMAQEERERFFDELVNLHSAAVRAGLGGAEAAPREPAAAMATAAEGPAPAPAAAEQAALAAGPDAAQAGVSELLVTRFNGNDVEIEEISLVGLDEDEGEAEIKDTGAGEYEMPDAIKHQVDGLKRGDWVEFRPEADKPVRERLSWVSPQRSTFLFTSSHSARATSVTAQALAFQLKQGSARIVSEPPLFERAVRGVLRSLHAG